MKINRLSTYQKVEYCKKKKKVTYFYHSFQKGKLAYYIDSSHSEIFQAFLVIFMIMATGNEYPRFGVSEFGFHVA